MVLPYIWSILFFFTLVLLGIDSIFASVESGLTVLIELIELRGLTCRRELLAAIVCSILCLCTLPFMFQPRSLRLGLRIIVFYNTN